jgi:hypothetical protein
MGMTDNAAFVAWTPRYEEKSGNKVSLREQIAFLAGFAAGKSEGHKEAAIAYAGTLEDMAKELRRLTGQ